MEFTLRQLETFIAVAGYGSASRAASELHMSQPAVSKAIHALEGHLASKLFERRGNRMSLNEVGRALLPHARNLVGDAREISDSFGRARQGLVGQLRIAASSTIANYIMPDQIGNFMAAQPGVNVSMSVGNTQQVLARLRSYVIDLAVIEGDDHGQDLHSIPWRGDQMVIFAPPTSPLAQYEQVSLEHLAEAKWIIRENGSGTRQNFERAIANKIERLDVALELGQTEAVKRAVALGYGIGCLSLRSIDRELGLGQLIVLPTPYLELRRSFNIVIDKNKHQSGLLRAFIDFLTDAPAV